MTRHPIRLLGLVVTLIVLAFVFTVATAGIGSATPVVSTAGGALPVPTQYEGTTYSAISCTSRSFCMAVGSYTNKAHFSFGVAAQWNGSQWSPRPLPLSENLQGAWGLSQVVCISPSWCMSLGGSNGVKPPFSELWNGSAWERKNIVTHVAGLGVILNHLSCTSRSYCLAVGNAEGGFRDAVFTKPVVTEWNGRKWSVLPPPKLSSGYSFSGVSCSGNDECNAIADTATLPAMINGNAVVVQHSESGWTVLPAQPASKNTEYQYQGISCTGASFCIVAGTSEARFQNGLNDREYTFIATISGSTWNMTVLRSISYMQIYTQLTCPYSRSCIVIIPGVQYPVHPAQVLSIDTGSGKIITIRTVPQVDALSEPCASPSTCSFVASSCSSCRERLEFIRLPAPWSWSYVVAAIIVCVLLAGGYWLHSRKEHVT